MPDQPPYPPVANRRVEPYPGDSPCTCGAVWLIGRALSATLWEDENADGVAVTHYRPDSPPTPCERRA